jgi:pimeloyl-ACP methyl ester carboxylesterase
VRIECSWLVVPEDRSHPGGRNVRLAVAVMRAASASGKTPVVFLHGGPGVSGIDPGYGALPGSARDSLRRDRDLVFYDQRGAGYSRPRLCPEYDDSIAANRNRITRATGSDVRAPLIRACIASLGAAGINPDAYNTTASAHDLVDLRRALGHSHWDVDGASYGARLAQEAMRVDPAGIRSVVLIGPVPPALQQLDSPVIYQRTLERLFAACAADAACRAAFPAPERDFYELYDELGREPLRVPAGNGRDTLVLHANRFTVGINSLLANSAQMAHIPLILHELPTYGVTRRALRCHAARASRACRAGRERCSLGEARKRLYEVGSGAS